jgi:hypothetical protein
MSRDRNCFRVKWTAWLKPRYVWYRIKWLFGWRPEWIRTMMSWRLRPQTIILDQSTADDLMKWTRDFPTFHISRDKFEKAKGELLKYDFPIDWGKKEE